MPTANALGILGHPDSDPDATLGKTGGCNGLCGYLRRNRIVRATLHFMHHGPGRDHKESQLFAQRIEAAKLLRRRPDIQLSIERRANTASDAQALELARDVGAQYDER